MPIVARPPTSTHDALEPSLSDGPRDFLPDLTPLLNGPQNSLSDVLASLRPHTNSDVVLGPPRMTLSSVPSALPCRLPRLRGFPHASRRAGPESFPSKRRSRAADPTDAHSAVGCPRRCAAAADCRTGGRCRTRGASFSSRVLPPRSPPSSDASEQEVLRTF